MLRKIEKNTSLAIGLRLFVVVLLFAIIILSGYLVFSHSYYSQYTRLDSVEVPFSQNVKKVSLFQSWAPFSYSVSATTTVPIWYYHHIRHYNNPADATGQALSVTPETFREQLRWMAENNYITITPEQLLQLFNGHLILPIGKKPAMITFDDGYDNMLTEVYPILKEFNFTGLFFVCPGLWNNPGYLTPAQIKFLDQNGMSFGGHTMAHVDLKASDQATQFREMKGSKDELEILLGHPIISMAYPYGMFSTKTKDIAQTAGFTISMSTLPGFADSKEDWMQLTRVRMYESKDFRRVLPL